MRIRSKPWALPKLKESSFFVEHPTEFRGVWHHQFEKKQPFWLELGCGKGGFISKLAPTRPDINFLAIDVKKEMLVLAKDKIDKEYAERGLLPTNVKITLYEIMLILKMMSPEDVVERIYINFCNPWYKTRHIARRLTHPNQLKMYRTFLADNGEIRFKTDDDDLFRYSVEYFKETDFEITYITHDLANSGFTENIPTEHEQFFMEEGKKIKFLIARKLNLPT